MLDCANPMPNAPASTVSSSHADSTAILRSLAREANGLSLAELLALHPHLARRTLQRRLAEWAAAGLVKTEGEARARRYRLAPKDHGPAYQLTESRQPGRYLASSEYRDPDEIPLSLDSQDILTYVEQPLHARIPVGYQRDFLESYQPNVDAYLPASTRRQLHKIGATPVTRDNPATPAPAGTYGRAILNRLLIDLSWASSHLEGNTYSQLDTVELVEHGRAATGKAASETQMILNHKAAIEFLVESIDELDFNRHTLMNLHALLSENLMEEAAYEGAVRSHAVGIGHSVYRPIFMPQLLNEMFDLMLDKARQIHDPFEQSFFIMVHLPYLQPFADINKRTARLAANLPLCRANLCPLTFLGVPVDAFNRAIFGVYEMTRVELLRDLYVWAYERSTREYLELQKTLAEPDPLRLIWRTLIRQTVRSVVLQPERDPVDMVHQAVDQALDHHATDADRRDLRGTIIDELRRLHPGVLARYGLRPSELARWEVDWRRGW